MRRACECSKFRQATVTTQARCGLSGLRTVAQSRGLAVAKGDSLRLAVASTNWAVASSAGGFDGLSCLSGQNLNLWIKLGQSGSWPLALRVSHGTWAAAQMHGRAFASSQFPGSFMQHLQSASRGQPHRAWRLACCVHSKAAKRLVSLGNVT